MDPLFPDADASLRSPASGGNDEPPQARGRTSSACRRTSDPTAWRSLSKSARSQRLLARCLTGEGSMSQELINVRGNEHIFSGPVATEYV